MIRTFDIQKKQDDIKALADKLNNVGTEINKLQTEWEKSDRKTGDTQLTGAYIQFNELLNQIYAKKKELAVLKREAKNESVPAWNVDREEIGLECY